MAIATIPRRARAAVSLKTYAAIASCAALAGAYFGAAIGALLLYVNPDLPSSPAVIGHVLFIVLPIYGGALTLLYGAVAAAIQPFLMGPLARRPFDPLLSTWLLLLDLALLAAVYGMNALQTEFLLSPRQHAHIVHAGVGLVVAFALCMTAHAVQALYPARRHAARRALVLVALATLYFVYAQRRPSMGTPARRHSVVLDVEANRTPMIVVAIDGLSFDQLKPLEAEGRLPAFSRLLSEGTTARVRSLHPCDPAITWTTVATGKLPYRHQVSDAVTFSLPGLAEPFGVSPRYLFFHRLTGLGIVRTAPLLQWDRTALAFWNILPRAGASVGLVNWPDTYPAERLRGFIVSDYLIRSHSHPIGLSQLTFPEHLAPQLLLERVAPDKLPESAIGALVTGQGKAQRPEEARLREILRGARARDLTTEQFAARLMERYGPTVRVVRYSGLETVLRYFLRYHRPESFGDVPAALVQRYGSVIPAYYEILDRVVGAEMKRLPASGVLVVLSASGMEPMTYLQRIFRLSGDPLVCATRDRAPDGALLIWGHDIQRGVALEPVDVADVVPTLLYAQGLPTARDMDGDPIFEAFTDDYKTRTPVSTIASYEAARIGPARPEGKRRLPADDDAAAGAPPAGPQD